MHVVPFAIATWLAAGLASAFDASSILDAKLRVTGRSGFPCLLRGAVTMRISTEEFYLQDETSGVRVTSAPYVLQEGDRLELEGWLYLAESGEFQMRATQVWHLGNGPPVAPRLVALPDAYGGAWQGQLVAVRGSVLNVDFGAVFDTISIQSGRSSLRVFYPANHRGLSAFEQIYPGMQVAVTGISVPQTADPEYDGYQVRLRGPADLAIRRTLAGNRSPSPVWAGSLAALALVGGAAWIWSSRQQQRRARSASQVQ